jgi:hypothetical protein
MNSLLKRWLARTALSTTLAAALWGAAAPARADEQTVKLIKLLIQKGILSANQAQDLLKETAGSAPAPHARARHGAGTGVVLGTGQTAPAGTLDSEAEEPTTAGQIRVTYVPQFIRKQIADQVRAQVMDEAQQEGWAAPNALPEWTQRFKFYGDLRMRYDADMFDRNNANQFVNFNGINSGTGFDANNYGVGSNTQTNPAFLNSTEDRNRFRLRARLGADIAVDDWITADIRIGTGNDATPSLNQTLGQNGAFDKYQLWLDRGYFTLKPLPELTIFAGRSFSPFMTSDLMFYPDLGFDGISLQYRQHVAGPFSVFVNGGAFPIFNTAFDFSTNSDIKYGSTDAYLTAIQGGVDWQVRPDVKAQLGIGIFDYLGVQGAISQPCAVQLGGTFACNTDATRATNWQFGNSVYPIRNIIPYQPNTTPASNPPDPQYYGLASRFDVLNVHPIVDINTYHPFDIRLEGEFMKNLAFNANAIEQHGAPREVPGPVNNLGANGNFLGGDTGYMVKATLGQVVIHKRWDWNAFFSYRYLESDSTLGAIADYDFHDGGTNAQGYIVGGSLGIGRETWLAVKLLSAQAISGPHYGTDSVFFDLNSSF